MCTLALANRALPDAPLAVAATRDEHGDRPSIPPRRWDRDPPIVAPRDGEAGGTWIGYNDAGVLAAITNRWTPDDIVGERSRGHLVLDALGGIDAAAAVRAVEAALLEDTYEGFNLVVADADEAVVLEWDGRLRASTLAPGLHVVTNTVIDDRGLDHGDRSDTAARQARTVDRVRRALDPAGVEDAGAWLDRAGAVLGDHDVGACVHADGYGTQSASLIALAADGRREFRYANGPPCTAAFEAVRA